MIWLQWEEPWNKSQGRGRSLQQGEGLIMVIPCTTAEIDGKLHALIVGASSRPFLMAAQIRKRKYLLQPPYWSRSLAQRGQLCHD